MLNLLRKIKSKLTRTPSSGGEIAKILLAAEARHGKSLLSKVKTQCDEYSREVLGSARYVNCLCAYSCLSGGFKEGYIPGSYYGRIVVPHINGNHGKIASLGSLPKCLFPGDNFPDIGYVINGNVYDTAGLRLKEKQFWSQINNAHRIVFKIDDTSMGEGVHILKTSTLQYESLQRFPNGCLQEYVTQHAFFDQMMSTSAATIRVLTCVNPHLAAEARACYLRLGRKHDGHIKSSSHVRIPVNLESGCLDPEGFLPDYELVSSHPDSGFVFDGVTVPEFNKLISTVVELHNHIPFVGIIGWDAIINSANQIAIFEWNASWPHGVFPEAAQGPCFVGLGWENIWRGTRRAIHV